MSKITAKSLGNPDPSATVSFQQPFQDASDLDACVRQAAKTMIQQAIELEVQEFLDAHANRVDAQGRRYVIRNGHLPVRQFLIAAGPIEVSQPRVRDKSPNSEDRVVFMPQLLPRYLRRSKAVDELVPWMYLKGISTSDFPTTLQSIFGESVKNLSANTVVRLKEKWTAEYEGWNKRDLAGKHYVYFWVDGIHVNVRLEDEADRHQCILVIIGATADGRKELVAVSDGYRESEASWTAVLQDLKRRGLAIDPKLAVGDGALGFWAALRKTMPATKEQRCWFHKTANVLNCLPKSLKEKAKQAIHEIWMSPTKEKAEKAMAFFQAIYEAKYPKAVECLKKDRDELLAFYDFPAEHWAHLRTGNPIESSFSTIRLRHRKTKGSGTRRTSLAMMYKLAESASKRWKRLKGYEKLEFVVKGRIFKDGEIQQDAA